MITFENVSYHYSNAEKAAVEKVSFELEEGSFNYLTGPSGAGKTTLFRMMYMDMTPTKGRLTVFGRNVSAMSQDDISLMRRRMGIVFQDFRLLPHLTVKENVSLPLTLTGPMSQQQESCVDEIIDWVGLGHKSNILPGFLSGGEKQRVAIARAVVNRPRLLIADEPTGNVDASMGRRIMHLFTELNKQGTTLLIATHDRELMADCPAPSIIVENGRISKLHAA